MPIARVVVHFLQRAVVHQFRAMVAGDQDQRLVQQIQRLQPRHQLADAFVHERAFAIIIRDIAPPHLLAVRGLHSDDRFPALVPIGIVHVGIGPRRVPGLVRIEAIDIEEKRRVFPRLVDETDGFVEDLRRQIIVLGFSILHIEQILNQPRLRADAAVGRQVFGHVDGVHRADAPGVFLLAADEFPAGEAAREVLRRLEHVVGVRDESRGIALFEKRLGQRRLLRRNLVPARGVGPQSACFVFGFPGKTAHAGQQRAAELNRRLAFAEGVVEKNAFADQPVHVRRSDRIVAPRGGDEIGAEGVEANQHNVHEKSVSLIGYESRASRHCVAAPLPRFGRGPGLSSRRPAIRRRHGAFACRPCRAVRRNAKANHSCR
ncbi:MAG: hypothetical protein BWZ10_02348 [candidate division BRC1 bacterium ADurb.BinA364]|nr:MAG: hypothetical protein BWZ10_02348 [candidate division BRC1 bacterium ADurb.BinA364]